MTRGPEEASPLPPAHDARWGSLPSRTVPAKASACGKTILVGEHAAVYGAGAVAMPLRDMRLGVELTPVPKADNEAVPMVLKLGGKDVSDRVGGVVLDACRLLGMPPFPAVIRGASAIPIGAGLGSSATLCVGILRALLSATGRQLPAAELARLANALEARFHGNPSGLDVTVVAYEACVLFAKGKAPRCLDITPLRSAPDGRWPFALIDSGIRASTLTMVNVAAPFFQRSGDATLARFDALASAVADGLAQGDHFPVADAMRQAGALLDEAGVVTPHLRDIIASCDALGTLAAKPTGAGGGGVVLAFLDPGRAEAQSRALRETFGEKAVYFASL